MSKLCPPLSGGKGNLGRFIERDRNVCAAGLPTAQPELTIPDGLSQYLLQDEVDALISDAIIPKPPRFPALPMRKTPPPDMRNAYFGEVAQLINPPNKTKFQTLVEDFKEASYTSYWKKKVGEVPDPTPLLPEGFDVYKTTLGMKTPFHGQLYDIILPKNPIPEQTPASKLPGIRTNRKYCDSFNPSLTYGKRDNVDVRGRLVKCCLTDDRIVLGTSLAKPINSIQSNIQTTKQATLGTSLVPNNNISCVPKDYRFGVHSEVPDNILDCLTTCELNKGKEDFLKCLAHLNNLRKCVSKRFQASTFHNIYLELKYYDIHKTDWLPKNIIYDICASKHIRFQPSLIEPLLSMWSSFDGSRIKYKTFVQIINYKEPLPTIPKIPDIPAECIDFRTTYNEMVKPGQDVDRKLRAGLASGRYFDRDYPTTPLGCCLADRAYLPDESDSKACLNPSIFTLLGINHRDMYAKRAPDLVRQVFEAAGEQFTEDTFSRIWDEAKKYHSQGWVSYETFRRALGRVGQTFK